MFAHHFSLHSRFRVLMVLAVAGFSRMACAPATAFPQDAIPVSTENRPLTVNEHAWKSASLQERIRLAEKHGEAGARQYAKAQGWSPLFDGTGKKLPQGLDQVYIDKQGTVHVIEAKGGGSHVGHAYGYSQGSSEWAVKAATRTRHSPSASLAEKIAAKKVLEAAAKSKLKVHVVNTPHIAGQPGQAVLKQTVETTDEAALLAQASLEKPRKPMTKAVAKSPLSPRPHHNLLQSNRAGPPRRHCPKPAVPPQVARSSKRSPTERLF